MPAIHSSKLRRVSRAKSWRCETRRSITYFKRGSEHWELMRCTFSVMFSIVRSLSTGTDALPGPLGEAMMISCDGVDDMMLVGIISQSNKDWMRRDTSKSSIRMKERKKEILAVKLPRIVLHTC